MQIQGTAIDLSVGSGAILSVPWLHAVNEYLAFGVGIGGCVLVVLRIIVTWRLINQE